MLQKLQNILEDHYRTDSTSIYIHSSVVRSGRFDELIDCIKASKFVFAVFSTGVQELDNIKLLDQKLLNKRADILLKYINSGSISVSKFSEYDLTGYNRQLRNGSRRIVVVFGQKKPLADFAVHCISQKPLNVLLLGNTEQQSWLIDPEMKKSELLTSAYTALWDKTPCCSYEQIKKGSKLYFVKEGRKKEVELLKPLSFSTGEGRVYETSISGMCCKVYHNRRLQRGLFYKLNYMTSQNKRTDNAAWPESIVYNSKDQPVGFLMKQANGESLDKLVYQLNEADWLKNACGMGYAICQGVFLLHFQNVIIGDIAPRDIFLTKQMKCTFIDADSFQFDNYPCPGYTFEYCCPDLDTSLLTRKLRPVSYEYFSLSVILFELLMHGHFPNEHTDNFTAEHIEDVSSNNARMFDYRHMQFQLVVGGAKNNAPDTLARCWDLIPAELQTLFVDTFNYKRIVSPAEWQIAFAKVLKLLSREVQ